MTTAAVSSAPPSRGLHIGLWIVQVLLGLAFLAAGFAKLTMPADQLLANMPYVATVGEGVTRFAGFSEVLGGLGLILPSVTRIKPALTPLAALGLVIVMVLGAAVHVVRGEFASIGVNVVLGGLAAFVAWGRGKRAPIAPR